MICERIRPTHISPVRPAVGLEIGFARVTCCCAADRAGASGTMAAMSASLVCLLLRQVPQMLTRIARDGGANDVEVLVLRQVAVLRRRVHRPALEPADRMALAVLSRLLPPSPLVGVLRDAGHLLRWTSATFWSASTWMSRWTRFLAILPSGTRWK
jgi:hypothetical protein